MKMTKYHLLAILQVLPFQVFAHGQEVLFTFFLPVFPAIIFLAVVSSLRLNAMRKKLLLGFML